VDGTCVATLARGGVWVTLNVRLGLFLVPVPVPVPVPGPALRLGYFARGDGGGEEAETMSYFSSRYGVEIDVWFGLVWVSRARNGMWMWIGAKQ
jgi:hypothetical protein